MTKPTHLSLDEGDIRITQEAKLGGFLGFATTPSKTEFVFERSEYYLGDRAEV